MTDTPEAVAYLYSWPDGGRAYVLIAERRNDPEWTARHGLLETPLYTRPDADIVRQLVEACEAIVTAARVGGSSVPVSKSKWARVPATTILQVQSTLTAARAAGYGSQS